MHEIKKKQKRKSGQEHTSRMMEKWFKLCHHSPAFLHIVRALTGAGGEAVVQRIAEGAHGIRSGPAREAGGGGLVGFAAALPALPLVGVAAAACVRIQAAGAAVIQLIQGLQGERARLT